MRADRSDRSRTPPIRVVIADDHAVVREGVRAVLEADAGFAVVAEASDGVDAERRVNELRPDVLLLDLSMPGATGLDVLGRVRLSAPDTQVLVLSIHDHEEYVLRSVRAGALGYLRKDSSPAELRDAIRAVHAGRGFFTEAVARTLADALRREHHNDPRERVAALTTRERDVLVEIANGRTNKEIGTRLGISVRTVESHRETLMRKLALRGAASLTRFAIDAGLVSSTTEK